MNAISGVSNWKLMIREEAEGITIHRAVTCDREAVLPEELLGKPVTVLSHHALAAGNREAEGEPLTIIGAPGKAEWDNANLHTLTLPRALRRIGNYAFLNCGRLQKLILYDNIQVWGGSVFMNCRKLNAFRLTRERPAQGETLAYLNDVLTNELDITVVGADGSAARLIFPEYMESYEENCPAHHFDLKIFGPGYPYHHCFSQKRLDLAVYDRLWANFLRMDHEPETALKIAWYRLRYPDSLRPEAREQYGNYLKAHAAALLRFCLESGDAEGLRLALQETAPPREALAEACACARELGRTQAVAMLLEEQRRMAPQRKIFEL